KIKACGQDAALVSHVFSLIGISLFVLFMVFCGLGCKWNWKRMSQMRYKPAQPTRIHYSESVKDYPRANLKGYVRMYPLIKETIGIRRKSRLENNQGTQVSSGLYITSICPVLPIQVNVMTSVGHLSRGRLMQAAPVAPWIYLNGNYEWITRRNNCTMPQQYCY
uniref:Uncharacterized protein n=1 Tax=Pseudonaja textilis TaxID=8673 RepID=A0A670YPP7_PSETE